MEEYLLNNQSQFWEKNFSTNPEMFGRDPSYPAKETLKILREKNFSRLLELGAGLGRDTLFFGKNQIKVNAIDYSKSAIDIINSKIIKLNLNKNINTRIWDVRNKLPFEENSLEVCYSHMLYCMALNNNQIYQLNNEIHRVLKPGGLNIYTVRNTEDGDYNNGIERGTNLFENDGFIIHFFSKEKIKKLLDGFINLKIEYFEEGKFPRRLYMVVNEKI